jgi:hypothetical protein
MYVCVLLCSCMRFFEESQVNDSLRNLYYMFFACLKPKVKAYVGLG